MIFSCCVWGVFCVWIRLFCLLRLVCLVLWGSSCVFGMVG